MKKIKYLFFALFVVFSFYFTDRIMLYIENKNPIMQNILDIKDNYYIKPVNAIINDNTIIPGISGKEINPHKSLLKMEEFGSFNETYLIYNKIKPEISLDNNKDKIIIGGNKLKRAISLIIEDNNLVESYLNENNIKYDIIAKLDTNLKIKREYINGENNEKKASDLNSLFNKNKINSKICLLNYSNIDYCKKKKYFIVKDTLNTSLNIIEVINKLESGDIILLKNSFTIENLKILLKEINKLDLEIVYISDLIDE